MSGCALNTHHRWLVVDDDEDILEAIRDVLEARSQHCAYARTLEGAHLLWARLKPDLVLLDVSLPDGTSVEWLARHRLDHRATIVAMSGCASAWQGHQLAHLGVRAFLEKPFREDELWAAVERATQPPDLGQAVAACVGHLGLHDAETIVRRTMIEEALNRASQNRRGAARILSVSRELLQHAIRKLAS